MMPSRAPQMPLLRFAAASSILVFVSTSNAQETAPAPAVPPAAQPEAPPQPAQPQQPPEKQPQQPPQTQPQQPQPQQPQPQQPPPPVAPEPVQLEPEQPATTVAEPAAPSAAQPAPSEAAESEATVQAPPVVEVAAPAELPAPDSGPEPSWADELDVSFFADAYYSLNYNRVKPQAGRNRFRAYDTNNGFALSWAGVDVAYPGDKVGGTLSLRFGPSASSVAGGAETANHLANVKQAYATWRPSGADGELSLDFGKFDTIYGAEVAESQLNYNYTRGFVNWLAQPVFHTGLRLGYQASPQLALTGLLVNGWNNTVDNNAGKSLGVQLSFSSPRLDGDGDMLAAHLGYMIGPEQDDVGIGECPAGSAFVSTADGARCEDGATGNTAFPLDQGSANTEGLRHFIDLILSITPTDQLAFVLNGDIGIERVRGDAPVVNDAMQLEYEYDSQVWWGVALTGNYQFSDMWAGALRGEIYGDKDGRATPASDDPVVNDVDLMLYSATLSVQATPAEHLSIFFDQRVDVGSEKVFYDQLRSYSDTQVTSTLGVIVHTD